MTEFRFTNDHSSSGVADVVDVLRQPRLWIPTQEDYPGHAEWLDKTEALIGSGQKRAMSAHMGRDAIGAVIYQQSLDTPSTVEIRNISVLPDARGRYVGAFLLRTAEIEARRNDFKGVEQFVVDTKLPNEEMISFVQSQGYSIVDIIDLYGLGTGLDVVMSKAVND